MDSKIYNVTAYLPFGLPFHTYIPDDMEHFKIWAQTYKISFMENTIYMEGREKTTIQKLVVHVSTLKNLRIIAVARSCRQALSYLCAG